MPKENTHATTITTFWTHLMHLIHLASICMDGRGDRSEEVRAVVYDDGSGRLEKGREDILVSWDHWNECEILILRWIAEEMEGAYHEMKACEGSRPQGDGRVA